VIPGLKLHLEPSGRSHIGAHRRVGCKLRDGAAEGIIAIRDDARDTVSDNEARSALIHHHRRNAGRHRLLHDIAERVGAGGKQKDVESKAIGFPVCARWRCSIR
jgi:hypothetical protein